MRIRDENETNTNSGIFSSENGEITESRILDNITSAIFRMIPDLSQTLDKRKIISGLTVLVECNLLIRKYVSARREQNAHDRRALGKDIINYENALGFIAKRVNIAKEPFIAFVRAIFVINEFETLYPEISHSIDRVETYFAIIDCLSDKALAAIILGYCTPDRKASENSIREQFKIFTDITRASANTEACMHFIIEGCISIAMCDRAERKKRDVNMRGALIYIDEFVEHLAELDPARYEMYQDQIILRLGSITSAFSRDCLVVAQHINKKKLFVNLMNVRNALTKEGLLKPDDMITTESQPLAAKSTSSDLSASSHYEDDAKHARHSSRTDEVESSTRTDEVKSSSGEASSVTHAMSPRAIADHAQIIKIERGYAIPVPISSSC